MRRGQAQIAAWFMSNNPKLVLRALFAGFESRLACEKKKATLAFCKRDGRRARAAANVKCSDATSVAFLGISQEDKPVALQSLPYNPVLVSSSTRLL